MDKQLLRGQDAGPWSDLAERVSRVLRRPTAYAIRALLTMLCEHPEALTPEQRAAAGIASRRLLEFAWTSRPRDPGLIGHAIETVCRTFESDPVASQRLLRRVLEQPHLAEHGFEELPRLAREIKRLIRLDPAFSEEIYRAAFAHQEESRETTPMGTGRILPLTSNRQQDYEHALYLLAAAFPEFLARAPAVATRVLIHVVAEYVRTRHRDPRDREEPFDFAGRQGWIRADYSSIWDTDVYRHDDAFKMLDTFEKYMGALAQRPEAADRLQEILEVVVRENRLAVVWRRLLRVGSRSAHTLGRALLPLVRSTAVLTWRDTSQLAGQLLGAVFPGLTSSEKSEVEEILLALPDTLPSDRREHGERVRARLLGCLPEDQLVHETTRQLVSELRTTGSIPPNVPPVTIGRTGSRSHGEAEYLADEGVPVDTEPNRAIRELEQPVREFTDRHLNFVPSRAELEERLPALNALHVALAAADEAGVHPKQRDHAWLVLVEACAKAAMIDQVSCAAAPGRVVRTMLLEASSHPDPEPDGSGGFDESPSWSPAVRIEAATGVTALARVADCADPDVLDAVERLSRDPVAPVRYQIARRLDALAHTAPSLMWRLLSTMCEAETSRGVLQGVLSGPLDVLAHSDPVRVTGLVRGVLDRTTEGPGVRPVRDLIDILTGLYLWRDHPSAREVVVPTVDRPGAATDDAHRILAHLRVPLRHGPVAPPDPRDDAIRGRAIDLAVRLLRNAKAARREIEVAHEGLAYEAWPETDKDRLRKLLRLIDDIGAEFYFASGAYDLSKDGNLTSALEPGVRERFYREMGHLFDELADVGLPSVTHHLLQTLESFISLDPREVFLRIGRVVHGGITALYQYEQLGVDLLVKLVERYLAEHRALFREDAACRQTLLKILDIFVKAGWLAARQLTYRLDDIFR